MSDKTDGINDCIIGLEAKKNASAEYIDGFASQYELEQQQTHKTTQDDEHGIGN